MDNEVMRFQEQLTSSRGDLTNVPDSSWMRGPCGKLRQLAHGQYGPLCARSCGLTGAPYIGTPQIQTPNGPPSSPNDLTLVAVGVGGAPIRGACIKPMMPGTTRSESCKASPLHSEPLCVLLRIDRPRAAGIWVAVTEFNLIYHILDMSIIW